MGKRFVLLDRDGTVIVDKHYLHDPDGVELLPGAVEGLRRMRELGFGLALLTNQSGVGRGYFSEDDMHACNDRLVKMLAEQGVVIDAVYHCPHAPEENCRCRKPEPGMMIQASEELRFDPFEAFMIGDKCADVLLGKNTGAVSILVRTGKGAKEEAKCGDAADYVVDDLRGAAEVIAELKTKQDGRMASPRRPQ
ncbi:D-glycero-beta-D-manno-heptose 1,7-bisphosphate 7-phosphatase [Salidesulfovibrio onnuriiensis]|uniref:D-glycero-beta-D-manno-heptose 1,7-bisphosphate 7-phosphatase n=1 Tax=Salidesulfovibrio onnuriiensis TaxID=2583823 RepID=UPI0011C9E849|nr:D-glycero-beta-D-manno-heptose 1,7-bisphosphate 7-phosphatase [Salidesulfovibrio onnuriiensis]